MDVSAQLRLLLSCVEYQAWLKFDFDIGFHGRNFKAREFSALGGRWKADETDKIR